MYKHTHTCMFAVPLWAWKPISPVAGYMPGNGPLYHCQLNRSWTNRVETLQDPGGGNSWSQGSHRTGQPENTRPSSPLAPQSGLDRMV